MTARDDRYGLRHAVVALAGGGVRAFEGRLADVLAFGLGHGGDNCRPRRELDQAVAGLHHAANLASLARQYREAAALPRELAVP